MAINPDDELRMYAVVSASALKLMGGNRGKLGAQLGHAYLHAYWDAEDRHPDRAAAYRASGCAKKVVLLCNDDEQMKALVESYRSVCGITEVVDAGLTVFEQPTFTAVGLGPLKGCEREAVLAGLRVLM